MRGYSIDSLCDPPRRKQPSHGVQYVDRVGRFEFGRGGNHLADRHVTRSTGYSPLVESHFGFRQPTQFLQHFRVFVLSAVGRKSPPVTSAIASGAAYGQYETNLFAFLVLRCIRHFCLFVVGWFPPVAIPSVIVCGGSDRSQHRPRRWPASPTTAATCAAQPQAAQGKEKGEQADKLIISKSGENRNAIGKWRPGHVDPGIPAGPPPVETSGDLKEPTRESGISIQRSVMRTRYLSRIRNDSLRFSEASS